MSNTFPNILREPGPCEMVVFKVTAKTAGAEVVKRDDDILTPQEVKQHWAEVCKAMLKELQTWAKLGCFSRKDRKKASNIIATRWVNKWKWELPTTTPKR